MEHSTPVGLVFADPVLFPFAQPYGLNIIRQSLAATGIRAEIILPFQEKHPFGSLECRIRDLSARIIGISFRNLDSAGFGHSERPYSFVPVLSRIIDVCRKASPTSVIVLGGSGFSIDPYNILGATGGDLGFIGPAEDDFTVFVERVLGRPVEMMDIPSLVSDLRSAILPGQSTSKSFLPRNRLPLALSSSTVNYYVHPQAFDFAHATGATVPVRTKTGCSLRCSYCVVPFIEQLNLRPIEDVVTDLRCIESFGAGKRIFMADGEFNLPTEERATELCRAISAEFKSRLRWKCYVCPSQVSDRLAAAMAEAGCVGVGVTVDSFSDDIRRIMGKQCSAERAEAAVRSFLSVGIATNFTLLFGAPSETLESLHLTGAVSRHLIEEGAHVAVTIGLRIYPNTPLDRQARRAAYVRYVRGSLQGKTPYIFCSPLPRRSLARRVRIEFAGLPRVHWTAPIFNENSFFYRRLAQAHGVAQEGKWTEALEMLDRLPGRANEDTRVQFLKAKILRRAGKKSEALSILLGLDVPGS